MKQFETWNKENISISDRCVQTFSEITEKCQDLQDFCNIVEFILCLQGSAATVERIFSVVNSMWLKEKSRFSAETMGAMLVVSVRQNCAMQCVKLYNKVLKTRNFVTTLLDQ